MTLLMLLYQHWNWYKQIFITIKKLLKHVCMAFNISPKTFLDSEVECMDFTFMIYVFLFVESAYMISGRSDRIFNIVGSF